MTDMLPSPQAQPMQQPMQNMQQMGAPMQQAGGMTQPTQPTMQPGGMNPAVAQMLQRMGAPAWQGNPQQNVGMFGQMAGGPQPQAPQSQPGPQPQGFNLAALQQMAGAGGAPNSNVQTANGALQQTNQAVQQAQQAAQAAQGPAAAQIDPKILQMMKNQYNYQNPQQMQNMYGKLVDSNGMPTQQAMTAGMFPQSFANPYGKSTSNGYMSGTPVAAPIANAPASNPVKYYPTVQVPQVAQQQNVNPSLAPTNSAGNFHL